MYTIKEILHITDGQLVQGDPDLSITSVHFHSSKLKHKSLFVALTGGTKDGHDFLQAALAHGAVAALISNEKAITKELEKLAVILVKDTKHALQELAAHYRLSLQIPIIAITGSNGKTTTKDIVAHILSTQRKVYKTEGNLNNHLGLPLSLLQIKKEHQAAVLELGMNHAGEIDLLAGITKPTVSVITNVGDAHIEYFGSKEHIAQAKGELLPHTDPDGYCILNGDDPFVTPLAAKCTAKHKMYSLHNPAADVYATDILYTDQGTSFTLYIGNTSGDCFIPMFGHYNVANLLPGALIAHQLGYSISQISDSLLSLSISDMRFQIKYGPNQSIVINDAYNASPTSMKAACETFLEIYPQRKKVIILGDIFELGEQTEQLHTEVGAYLKEKNKDNDFILITVGDTAQHISREAGGTHFTEKERIAEALNDYLTPDYALFFKASRGMKLEEVVEQLLQK